MCKKYKQIMIVNDDDTEEVFFAGKPDSTANKITA